MSEDGPVRGLDRTEKILFAFAVAAFALLILLFGDGNELPIVIAWIVVGLGFIGWFDHHLKSR